MNDISQARAEQHLAEGQKSLEAGRLAEAERSFRAAVAACPRLVTTHGQLGHVLLQQGQAAEAAECYRKVLLLQPQSAEAMYWLAIAARDQKHWQESIDYLRRAISMKDRYTSAHFQLGLIYGQLGQFGDALPYFERLIELQPQSPEVHYWLGMTLSQLARHDEAAAAFRRALDIRPDDPQSHVALGTALGELGRLDEAKACYREAIRHRPEFAEAHNCLGTALSDEQDYKSAAAAFREALRRDPAHVQAWTNLGSALSILGDHAEAEACYRRAIAIDPNCAEAYNGLGMLLEEPRDEPAGGNRFDEALACYDRALALQPDNADVHRNRALAWLSLGRFAEGWAEYEWRFRCKGSPEPQFNCPRWRGENVSDATILLAFEQGFGDIMQFIRYAPLVRARCKRVIVESRAPLARLIATAPGVDEVYLPAQAVPEFDYYVPLLSVPGILGTNMSSIPSSQSYLTVDAADVERRRGDVDGGSHGGKLRVGIAWKGNSQNARDRVRSIPLASFAPLIATPGVRFYSLQHGEGREQLGQVQFRSAIADLGDRLGDFYETAALVRNLDLVITCDSAPAHLAGALGVPVWVALATAPDWRWLLDRDDSPWYPTMRLFRQREAGNWAALMSEIAAQLRHRLSVANAAVRAE